MFTKYGNIEIPNSFNTIDDLVTFVIKIFKVSKGNVYDFIKRTNNNTKRMLKNPETVYKTILRGKNMKLSEIAILDFGCKYRKYYVYTYRQGLKNGMLRTNLDAPFKLIMYAPKFSLRFSRLSKYEV